MDRPWWIYLRIADGKKILKCFLLFSFILSSPSGIETWTALHVIRRFRRQCGSRRSDTDNYTLLLYSIFRIFLLFSERFFHVSGKCKHLCYIIWKGYFTYLTVFSVLKVSHTLAVFKKKSATACIWKNPRKYKSIACGSRKPSCRWQKDRWLPLELLQKAIKYSFMQIECRIR